VKLNILTLILVGHCFLQLRAEHNHSSETLIRPPQDQVTFSGATDITMKSDDGSTHLCQSTLVARNPLKEHKSICRVAFLTAAHCVDSSFDAIEFSGFGEIKKSQLKLCRPREYARNKARFWKDNPSVPGDSATLIFEIPCDNNSVLRPARLAPLNEERKAALDHPPFFLQKRSSPAPENPGGGKRIQADIQESSGKIYHFHAPTPQGSAIVGGDSGGPIFDAKGRLLCPMMGSSYEYLRIEQKLKHPEPDGKSNRPVDPFDVSCDSRAIARLSIHLELFGMSNDPTQEVPSSQPLNSDKTCND